MLVYFLLGKKKSGADGANSKNANFAWLLIDDKSPSIVRRQEQTNSKTLLSHVSPPLDRCQNVERLFAKPRTVNPHPRQNEPVGRAETARCWMRCADNAAAGQRLNILFVASV